MNSWTMAALTPWRFQPSPHEGNAREQLLGQRLKRMGQPIHPPVFHRKIWLTQPAATLVRQVGSCHLQRRAEPLHMAFPDFCDLGHLQWLPLCKNCSRCLPPCHTPWRYSAWEKASSRSACTRVQPPLSSLEESLPN